MLALALLFGFTPWQPDRAPLDHAELPTGEPAPHLEYSPGLTVRMGQTNRWQAFSDKWPGRWTARFDPRTALPRVLYAPGVPEADAGALLSDIAELAGIPVDELVPAKPISSETRNWLRWERRWHGVPVEGDEVLMAVQQGKIGGIWVRLSPVVGLPEPREGEVVRPLPSDKGGLAVHLVTREESDGVVRYLDRSGRVVHAWSTHHYDEVQVSHLERTIGDAYVDSPARRLHVEDLAGATGTTASDGTHPVTGDLRVFLDGPELEIRRDGEVQSAIPLSPDSGGLAVMTGGVELSDASASVLHHFHVVFDWLDDRWPSHSWLGEKVRANVDISYSACNAYYTSGTINFFIGNSSSCYNFGQVADVIYHEVGHGIHHYILAGGTFAGDISEGSADFVSATITDDHVVGRNSKPGGGHVREIDTDRVYPDDVVNEVHADGLIWASFLWNLRAQWQATYGDEVGAQMTDLLFLGALEQGPSLTDVYDAVIFADDDNGDLSDGTPHACELVELLDHHGLGPGPLGVLIFDHAPLGPQGSAESGYPVIFDVYTPTQDCAEYDPDTVKLWFKVGDLGRVPGVDEDTPELWDGWEAVELTTDGEQFEGTIPRQLATAQVHYFMEAGTADGSAGMFTHGGYREGVHSFRVGDRAEVWCEDFEGGDPSDWVHGPGLAGGSEPDFEDQWEVTEPVEGGAFVPDVAVSGSLVMGTNVAGLYRNNNQQYLASPPIPTPDGRMTLLTFERWLTVEDGIYDQAEMRVDGELLFENRSSDGGIEHTFDVDWTLVEHDVDAWREGVAADGEITLEWSLRSDPGLEFGGWNLDDVCVVQLDDVPAHYQRMQLSAELDEEYRVALSWENPWIEPLDSVWLVGEDGDELVDPSASTTLLLLDSATPGAAGSYFDSNPLEAGESRTYAILAAADDDEGFFTELSEGDNRLTVSRAEDPVDTAEPDDTGGDSDETPPTEDTDDVGASGSADDGGKEECGCSSAPGVATAGWMLGLLALVGLRRRESPPARR